MNDITKANKRHLLHTGSIFVYKALEIIKDGRYVAMIFPQRYLSSKGRYKLFTENPPYIIYAFKGGNP